MPELIPLFRPLGREAGRPGAFLPLISICFSELRGDFAHLIESNWAEAPRRRARELLLAIEEACDLQGWGALALLARSMTGLTGLSPEKAATQGPVIRKRLEQFLKSAEGLV